MAASDYSNYTVSSVLIPVRLRVLMAVATVSAPGIGLTGHRVTAEPVCPSGTREDQHVGLERYLSVCPAKFDLVHPPQFMYVFCQLVPDIVQVRGEDDLHSHKTKR